MAQGRLWLLGLIPLALLWLIAIWSETSAVETDVGARAAAALAAGAWVPAEITTHGRDVTLGGDAYDPADREAGRATADAVSGVRLVDDQSRLVPESKPYTWSATKASSHPAATVALDGSEPTPRSKADLRATAGATGATVTDATSFARGAPIGFEAAATLALQQLARLTSGKATIVDGTLAVSGIAPDAAARDAAVAALGQLPPGFTRGETKITSPSFDFTAIKDAAKATLTLDGAVPDEAARTAILGLAHSAFAGQTVVDNTRVQPGAPPGFATTATTSLEQLSRLDSGTLKISGTAVELSGGALYARAVDQINRSLKALPSGFVAKGDIKTQPPAAPVDAPGCQTLFADQLGQGKIQFETASAKIDHVSAGILDHLVAIALRCPAQMIDVSGHTDASGSTEVNMDLSKRRAQAVVDYLVAAGVDAKHMTAIGYGKTRPIAPNDSEEGRAKNRRIEFLVK